VSTPDVAVATLADRERVVGSLVAAFRGDPVLRYLFPGDVTYPAYAAAFFGHLFDKRVGKRTIWTVEGGASTAIWEPPAGASVAVGGGLPAGGEVAAGRGVAAGGEVPVGDDLAGWLPAAELARVRAYDEAVHGAMPLTPYWYLGVLGTHPEFAGRRWGLVVMAEGLRRAAADGLPAVLETSKPGNVELYRRAGWEVVRTVTEPLPIWVMRR
jgi:hypothetical protein